METEIRESDFEPCGRCMQPVRHDAIKCTHCGMPRTRTRRFTITIGIVGLVSLIFVIILMVKVIRDADIEAAPADNPDAEHVTPAGPDKPPPLNK